MGGGQPFTYQPQGMCSSHAPSLDKGAPTGPNRGHIQWMIPFADSLAHTKTRLLPVTTALLHATNLMGGSIRLCPMPSKIIVGTSKSYQTDL